MNTDAPDLDVGRHRRARPVGLAHGARVGQEIGKLACVELALARRTALEELGAPPAEGALQLGREGDGLGAQDGAVIRCSARGDLDPGAVR